MWSAIAMVVAPDRTLDFMDALKDAVAGAAKPTLATRLGVREIREPAWSEVALGEIREYSGEYGSRRQRRGLGRATRLHRRLHQRVAGSGDAEEIQAVRVFARRLVEAFGYRKAPRARPQFRVHRSPSDGRRSYPVDIAGDGGAAHRSRVSGRSMHEWQALDEGRRGLSQSRALTGSGRHTAQEYATAWGGTTVQREGSAGPALHGGAQTVAKRSYDDSTRWPWPDPSGVVATGARSAGRESFDKRDKVPRSPQHKQFAAA